MVSRIQTARLDAPGAIPAPGGLPPGTLWLNVPDARFGYVDFAGVSQTLIGLDGAGLLRDPAVGDNQAITIPAANNVGLRINPAAGQTSPLLIIGVAQFTAQSTLALGSIDPNGRDSVTMPGNAHLAAGGSLNLSFGRTPGGRLNLYDKAGVTGTGVAGANLIGWIGGAGANLTPRLTLQNGLTISGNVTFPSALEFYSGAVLAGTLQAPGGSTAPSTIITKAYADAGYISRVGGEFAGLLTARDSVTTGYRFQSAGGLTRGGAYWEPDSSLIRIFSRNITDTADAARVDLLAGGEINVQSSLVTMAQRLTVGSVFTTGAAVYHENTPTLTNAPNLYLHSDNRLYKSSAVVITGANIGGFKAGDAELLDGLNSTQFLRSDTSDTISGQLTISGGPLVISRPGGSEQALIGYNGPADPYLSFYRGTTRSGYIRTFSNRLEIHSDQGGSIQIYGNNDVRIDGNAVLHAGNPNAFKVGDANTLDGLNSSEFLRSNANDVKSGSLELNGVLYADSTVFLRALTNTNNPPNLYIHSDGRLYESNHAAFYAEADWDALGSTVMAAQISGSEAGPGDVKSGSILRPTDALAQTIGGSSLPGNWMCVGRVAQSGTSGAAVTNWRRVL